MTVLPGCVIDSHGATAAYRRVYTELSAELDETMQALEVLFTEDLSRLNTELNRAGLPRVIIRDRLITE